MLLCPSSTGPMPLPPSLPGWFQLASALEILHAALGLVGGSPLTALMQWAGRSNVLFGVVAAVPEVQNRAVVGAMFLAWALSEVIRYPWYAASLAGACPHWLTWLRCVGWGGRGRVIGCPPRPVAHACFAGARSPLVGRSIVGAVQGVHLLH